MDWEEPVLTFVLFILFIYTTIKINAEYAFCCPIFIILALFSKSLIDRKSGLYKKNWIENGLGPGSGISEKIDIEKHQPVAVLRVAVVGFRNLPSFLPEPSTSATATKSLSLTNSQTVTQTGKIKK